MEFVAARVGSRTRTPVLAVVVSNEIPEIVGESVKVLFPVPAEAVNEDERRDKPSVVTTETDAALAEGWLEFPVGLFTLVTIREYELESVILASEFTEVRATKVVLLTVTNFDGVKFAVVVDVPV